MPDICPYYPLMPVDATLWTNHFWNKRKTIRTGIVIIEANAIRSPQTSGSCPKKVWIPTVSGRTSTPASNHQRPHEAIPGSKCLQDGNGRKDWSGDG